MQVAIYTSSREQALTVLHGDLVRTLNSLSGVAQLQQKSAPKSVPGAKWDAQSNPGHLCGGSRPYTSYCAAALEVVAHLLYFGGPFTKLNTSKQVTSS